MPSATIVVDRLNNVPWPLDGHRVITMDDYARDPRVVAPRSRIVNLCRDGYLSRGYYCSLLAEARGHSVLPGVATLVGMECPSLRPAAFDALGRAFAAAIDGDPSALRPPSPLLVAFGRTADPRFDRLAALAFEHFPCPLLAVEIDVGRRRVRAIRPLTGRAVRQCDGSLFRQAMERWLSGGQRPAGHSRPRPRPRLAILHDPADPLPPSKPKTLERFREAGRDIGLDVELIRHADADRLPGFDALFIRETTAVGHPSFQLAARADELGMPVIDDPASILRCCNKVFLAERLQRHGVATPRTVVANAGRLGAAAATLGYPLVLKLPDGCSSQGVFKVESAADLRCVARPLFDASHLVVAQEYVYTPYDWRITVLAGRVLFACRYHMAAGHWQIFRHGSDGRSEEGATECVPLAAVPRAVLDRAVTAAGLIGDGLYGVDLKETATGVLVIEVNDNPNIDTGLEDGIAGDGLYRSVLQEFLRRIERRDAPAVPRQRRPAGAARTIAGRSATHAAGVARHPGICSWLRPSTLRQGRT